MGKSLHPDVLKFKAFVKENPHVLRDVKAKEKTLQDLYEEWVLFGEDDPVWDEYKTGSVTGTKTSQTPEEESEEGAASPKSAVTAAGILSMIKSMNMNDLQNQLTQFNGALTSIQQLLSTFRPDSSGPSNTNTSSSPFSYKED
ncbi:YlbD family protein [Bacillus sp. H-16]|uniref:YlbD family protein n=1 Tax=Alteribacter salitolerans TaxID=2912333 RepID=UPI001966A8C2|nr:YlbD family protein [Alteribacter salitolerans]MBM7095895.1 YlbD family protein [Alteribacter salitolerans]